MRKDMGAEEVHKEENKQSSVELSTNESNLHRAIDIISSLISVSYSIKVFHVKWQLIRNKLEELNSSLTTARNCDFGEVLAFSELVSAILVTVNDCYDLANHCVEFSYSGKLFMQSNLDLITVKFEVLIKKLAALYNAGILTHGYAMVVSKPSAGASRGDMKFYVNDLLTRMKIGGSEMKRQVLMALNEVVKEDEKYVKIVVEMGEIITLLVDFLEFEELEIQEDSMKVILVIAGIDSCKGVLVGAGIISRLIEVLESGSDLGKEQAARCLQKLTENSNNTWSVSAHGGVTTLLKICTNGDGKRELIVLVCWVLKNLAGVEEIKRYMVEEGVIPTFIKLLSSKDEVVQINAIVFLQIMASGDEDILQIIIRERGILPLVCILDPKSSFSSKARKTALEAIDSFCFSSKRSINILMGCRFLDKLLVFLCNSEVLLQESALKAVLRLCETSEETKKAMGESGFMSELLILLDAKSFVIREMAAEALSSMLRVPRNRRRFTEEDCNTSRLLQLLDSSEGKLGNTRFLLSSLMSLTSCNSGRRKIAISSHLENLEKLAEAEVTEAKKIIRKLSTSRFRSIFSGIWSS